jgi:serine beta-lactamase-like protein LACTB, mitochondrial
MSMSSKHSWLLVMAVPAGLLLVFIMGVSAYVQTTKMTLHPDPQQVRSVTRADPSPEWVGAVEPSRRRLRTSLAAQNLPGLSVAVGVGGDIVWAEGFGWADVENQVPVTPETRFRVADASRALTSAAVGLLLEKSKLLLDDEVQVHVPEFPKKARPVTLRQLMAQVGGVPEPRGDEPLSADVVSDDARLVGRCERTLDALEKLDDFAQSELLFEPGTKYHPSSYGWVLVSAAAEAAAKQPFFSFMRTQVFDPLQMRETTVDVSTSAIPDRAAFYFPRFDVIADVGSLATGGAPRTRYGPKPARRGDYSCYAGAAAFLSTPSDLVRFGMATSRGTLLRPDTIRMLQTPQRLSSGKETGYGLGWELETLSLAGQPTRMAGHGSREGFLGGSTFLMTLPERGLVVAVMANISFADTRAIALDIAQGFAMDGEGRR